MGPLGLRGARFFLDRGFGNSGVRRLQGRSGTLHPRRPPREGCCHHPVAFPSVRLFAFVLPHHFISSSKFRRASPPPLASPDISLAPPRSQPQPEDLQDLLYIPNRPKTTPFHQRLPSSPCVGLPRGFRKAPPSPQHARKFAPGVKAGGGETSPAICWPAASVGVGIKDLLYRRRVPPTAQAAGRKARDPLLWRWCVKVCRESLL